MGSRTTTTISSSRSDGVTNDVDVKEYAVCHKMVYSFINPKFNTAAGTATGGSIILPAAVTVPKQETSAAEIAATMEEANDRITVHNYNNQTNKNNVGIMPPLLSTAAANTK